MSSNTNARDHRRPPDRAAPTGASCPIGERDDLLQALLETSASKLNRAARPWISFAPFSYNVVIMFACQARPQSLRGLFVVRTQDPCRPAPGAWRCAKAHRSGSKSGFGRWSHWDEIGWVHYREIGWSHSDEIQVDPIIRNPAVDIRGRMREYRRADSSQRWGRPTHVWPTPATTVYKH